MNRLLHVIGFVVLGCASATTEPPKEEADTVTIPLDQIWAIAMSGTHDIRELEPEKFGERTRSLPSEEQAKLFEESKFLQFQVALNKSLPSKGNFAPPGFVVLGTGREALDGACDVFVSGQRPSESFPNDSNVTLIFFSYRCGQYVRLDGVERRGKTIEVKYRFVSSNSDFTGHLALIPLGKLPVGKYRAEIIQLPGGKDSTGHITGGLPSTQAAQFVCQPFSFSIVNRQQMQ